MQNKDLRCSPTGTIFDFLSKNFVLLNVLIEVIEVHSLESESYIMCLLVQADFNLMLALRQAVLEWTAEQLLFWLDPKAKSEMVTFPLFRLSWGDLRPLLAQTYSLDNIIFSPFSWTARHLKSPVLGLNLSMKRVLLKSNAFNNVRRPLAC